MSDEDPYEDCWVCKPIEEKQQALRDLVKEGYHVEVKNDGYHFRINGVMDLYPVNGRWHDLRTNARGGAVNLYEFIMTHLPVKERKAGL